MKPPPQIIEKFADNGEFSHYELISSEGETLWSQDPDHKLNTPAASESEDDVYEELLNNTSIAHDEIPYLKENFTISRKGEIYPTPQQVFDAARLRKSGQLWDDVSVQEYPTYTDFINSLTKPNAHE